MFCDVGSDACTPRNNSISTSITISGMDFVEDTRDIITIILAMNTNTLTGLEKITISIVTQK